MSDLVVQSLFYAVVAIGVMASIAAASTLWRDWRYFKRDREH